MAYKYDKDQLKSLARGRWPEILSRLGGINEALLDGKHHACPKCQDGKDRFRFLDADAGAVYCNQCNKKKNGDGISALMWSTGWTFPDTLKRLAEYLNVSANGQGSYAANGQETKPEHVFPTLEDALASFDKMIGGARAGVWMYQDAVSYDVLAVVRWDLPSGDKTIRPFHKHPSGWASGDPPKPWPLYNLAEVTKANTILFVEGEKCVDAARSIGIVATTTAHGANSPQHSDLTPLAGKCIVTWRDNDESGQSFIDKVTEILLTLPNRPQLRHIEPPPEIPPKGDIADWLEQHDAAEPEQLKQLVQEMADAAAIVGSLPIVSCSDVASKPAKLRAPIIHGLQRQGETVNIIAPSKTGKTWLALSIGLSIATGRPWLGHFEVNRGRVLYVDNELHRETFQHRVETVVATMGMTMADVGDYFSWLSLRGKLIDLDGLAKELEIVEPDVYRVIILDAWYRLLPPDAEENDNAAMTQLYNTVDKMAERLKSGFYCVHHSSKGSQSGKSVTDVGSGAGAQARACDTHMILRAHQEEGAFILNAATRSFPPVESVGCRFQFPTWSIDTTLDPSKLRRESQRPKKEPAEKPDTPEWTPEQFAERFITNKLKSKGLIVGESAIEVGSERKAERLLAAAEAKGLAHRWQVAGKKREAWFCNQPQEMFTND